MSSATILPSSHEVSVDITDFDELVLPVPSSRRVTIRPGAEPQSTKTLRATWSEPPMTLRSVDREEVEMDGDEASARVTVRHLRFDVAFLRSILHTMSPLAQRMIQSISNDLARLEKQVLALTPTERGRTQSILTPPAGSESTPGSNSTRHAGE